MKSFEELLAIKEKMKDSVALRHASDDVRIVVGMGTCGIAAGARPVVNAFVEAVVAAGLSDKVTVTQTGCLGKCQYEPVVEICKKGAEKVTYGNVNEDKAREIVEKHVKGGTVVTEYTIENVKL